MPFLRLTVLYSRSSSARSESIDLRALWKHGHSQRAPFTYMLQRWPRGLGLRSCCGRGLLPVVCVYLALIRWLEFSRNEGFGMVRLTLLLVPHVYHVCATAKSTRANGATVVFILVKIPKSMESTVVRLHFFPTTAVVYRIKYHH